MRPPSASSFRPCAPGSTTRSSSPLTTRRLTGASSTPVALPMVSRCRECRSYVRFSWLARNGGSIQRGCPMSAVGSASHCVTTTQSLMRRHVRTSCSLPRTRDGGSADGNNDFIKPAVPRGFWYGPAPVLWSGRVWGIIRPIGSRQSQRPPEIGHRTGQERRPSGATLACSLFSVLRI